jgi:hypothetical protein
VGEEAADGLVLAIQLQLELGFVLFEVFEDARPLSVG